MTRNKSFGESVRGRKQGLGPDISRYMNEWIRIGNDNNPDIGILREFSFEDMYYVINPYLSIFRRGADLPPEILICHRPKTQIFNHHPLTIEPSSKAEAERIVRNYKKMYELIKTEKNVEYTERTLKARTQLAELQETEPTIFGEEAVIKVLEERMGNCQNP